MCEGVDFMNGCMNSFIRALNNLRNIGFVNSIVKNLSLNLRKKKYTQSRNICQLSSDTKCVSYM